MRIRCGRSQRVGEDEVIKEVCDKCKNYNKGWMAGFEERIKKNRRCQALTCSKAATHIVCEKEFLIDVCRGHVGTRQFKKIVKEDNDYDENTNTKT